MLADQLLVNGRIYTMDARSPLVSALAIAGERVLAVGDPSTGGSTSSPRCSGERLRGMLAPGGQVLDLGGRCVLPGLADSHIHFSSYALSLRALDLSRAATLREMVWSCPEIVEPL